ncbi:RAI1-domain-containing protein [Zopfia rhizophila CBS 207.26]|uniref:Decapping nuclease n=1 Tax=Zopfia rhizophila CBS 207.26 TaxID=1314779 RepID=A0A6A6DQI4_9PEZI|nr:RAI1-domain-containing protein [Zopfia rhizophila CBS 207.26]
MAHPNPQSSDRRRSRSPTQGDNNRFRSRTPPTSSLPPKPAPQPIQFPIQPLQRFQGSSASIKRPREIASFSFDDNHSYLEDDSGIQYYCAPQIGADLCEGFERFRYFEEKEDPHLDTLLTRLVSLEKKGERVRADFVTWRGMVTKIMTSPYDKFASFEMFATLHDGTIYIEDDFPSRLADCASQSQSQHSQPPRNPHSPQNRPSQEMMTYWGYKFETLSLLPTPLIETSRDFIENRRDMVVDNHAQYVSVITTAFGPHSLILGGEVDGVWDAKSDPDTPDPPDYIELKTAEELGGDRRDVLKFERKLLKFWAQSFLLGISKVIVGFRSKHGILRAVEVYDTNKIPGMVRTGTGCWDGNTCINFTTAFLGHLKQTIKDDGVYKISLKKNGGVVEVSKIQERGTGKIISKEFLGWRKERDIAKQGTGAVG